MLRVAFDGYGELCEIGVADNLSELSLGLEHSRGGPAQAHAALGKAVRRLRKERRPTIETLAYAAKMHLRHRAGPAQPDLSQALRHR